MFHFLFSSVKINFRQMCKFSVTSFLQSEVASTQQSSLLVHNIQSNTWASSTMCLLMIRIVDSIIFRHIIGVSYHWKPVM